MEIKRLKDLYQQNVNIMKTMRTENKINENDLKTILYSYDLQAGSYRKAYYYGESKNRYIGENKVHLINREYHQLRCQKIASYFNQLEYASILEVGVGEATTMCDLVFNLDKPCSTIHGIDISYSRIAYGQLFLKENGITAPKLSVADMFNLPYQDNSFDIVYTYHCIEPNTNKAIQAIRELYRVTKNYLILIEPSYELGNEETKRNIEKHSYCRNILTSVQELGYNLLEHHLFEVGTYTNQSAIFIIKKEGQSSINNIDYCCPICKNPLTYHHAHFYCEEDSLIYPVINNIPCLLSDQAILATKFLDPELNELLWNK